MKKLAIIGGGYMAGIFAINAKEMGLTVCCFSLKNGIVDDSLYDYIYEVNILDKEKVAKICKEANVDGVVATTELTIATAAYVADKLGLIGIDSKVAETITDKFRNRKAIMNIDGLLNPKYKIVSSVKDIIDSAFDYPIILKPTEKGGKRGISVINSEEDVYKAFSYAINDVGTESKFIVEEYIDGGIECSVESLSFKNKHYIIQITEKITSGPPHCVELGHHQPANISSDVKDRIINVLDKALTAIGLTNGACHTEIKIKGNKIYLIEFNARPGGDHIAYPLTQLSTGYEYIKGAIEIAMNDFKGIDKFMFKNKYSGVIFVTEQTHMYKDLYDHCEEYDWFYKKNIVTDDLQSIKHNNGFNINYFMYCSEHKPKFDI